MICERVVLPPHAGTPRGDTPVCRQESRPANLGFVYKKVESLTQKALTVNIFAQIIADAVVRLDAFLCVSLRVLRVLCGNTNCETAKSAKKAQRVAKADCNGSAQTRKLLRRKHESGFTFDAP